MKKNFTEILGLNISAINYRSALKKIIISIQNEKPMYVCVCAVHLLMECFHTASLRDGVNQAGLVTPDGMPLVWLSRIYGQKQTDRVYGPQLTLLLCRLSAQQGYPIFLVGGATGQGKKLSGILYKKFPSLKIAGWHDTPIRPIPEKQNSDLIKKINFSKAKIVFVGLGCPLQEKWMIENRNKLKTPVLIGVGAAFNFISGEVKQAPRWMQNNGLEWLFRLFQEPRRLAHRYFVYNTQFVFQISKQLLRDFIFKKIY